jgi:hypothetical protein
MGVLKKQSKAKRKASAHPKSDSGIIFLSVTSELKTRPSDPGRPQSHASDSWYSKHKRSDQER